MTCPSLGYTSHTMRQPRISVRGRMHRAPWLRKRHLQDTTRQTLHDYRTPSTMLKKTAPARIAIHSVARLLRRRVLHECVAAPPAVPARCCVLLLADLVQRGPLRDAVVVALPHDAGIGREGQQPLDRFTDLDVAAAVDARPYAQHVLATAHAEHGAAHLFARLGELVARDGQQQVLQPPYCRNNIGLGLFHFARHYSGNHFCFLFLCLLRCFSSAGSRFIATILQIVRFPHSEIPGSFHMC